MIARTDFNRLRPELLNPNMQVFAAWRKELQDALCECPDFSLQRYSLDGWYYCTDPKNWNFCGWRIDPSWSGPEEPVAKEVEEWEDVPIVKSANLNNLPPYIIYESGVYSICDIQTHPRFAGIVAHDGRLYLSWHEYAESQAKLSKDSKGYRIPAPKAVRMWKEVKP